MQTTVSGSSDVLISSMHFMKSGELLVEGVNLDDITQEDFSSLTLTQEFILYALQRDDWMVHFLSIIDKIREENLDQKRPKLTLIKGGLEDS
tara:strand:+ start:33 stop:308 length:276 start_codon:yes stop_codon:yes gene_type:complete